MDDKVAIAFANSGETLRVAYFTGGEPPLDLPRPVAQAPAALCGGGIFLYGGPENAILSLRL